MKGQVGICKSVACGGGFVKQLYNHYFCSVKCKTDHYRFIGKIQETMNRFNKTARGKARTKKYLSSEKGKKYNREKSARYRVKHPDRIVAVTLANRILENKSCEIRNCNERGEKHHEDYSNPLDVEYLCKDHHMELHWQNKEM